MLKIFVRTGFALSLFLVSIQASYAVDSYRFLHVHIDTLWFIFLFLLCIIFVPFILIAVLTWHYAEKKSDSEEQRITSIEGDKQ